MNENEAKEIIKIIDSVAYGEIVIKKEAHRIVIIKRTVSIKLKP